MYKERLESLRTMMRSKGWDAVIITGSDPHNSEYPAERWKQVQWLCGFTGEAGDIVVTLDHAGLWTDTRYFIQANIQLEGSGFVLHKTRVPEQVLIPEWLALNLDKDSIVAVDGLCQNASEISAIAGNFTVASVPNMLDALWKDRPAIPQTPVFTIDPGETRASKIDWLRDFIDGRECDGILLSSLDEIAWTLNVRASDIEYNPLVISYLLVRRDDVKWFVLKGNVTDEVTLATMDIVRSAGIEVLPYEDLELELGDMHWGRLFLDSNTINYHLWTQVSCDVVMEPSPVRLRKAVKNPTEIAGMRKAHLLDGAAMERFLFWLESSVDARGDISERDAADMLGRIRAEIPGYRGDSFETISACGKGAALPHYITPKKNAPVLPSHGLYLCDSGAQYDFGTTDITRTVPLGECSPLEKEDYTLVLKGHIDLAMAAFPAGTAGCQIDVLARNPLWQARRNFGHGTGHGVGYFLGVHEGPQDIRQNLNGTPLTPGMITSDEPGIYREGMHGVRHENLILCVESGNNDFGNWLEFETLTLCHFDTSCIVRELLDSREIKWLNDYNEHVFTTLSPYLSADVADWLREKTMPIQ